MNTTGNQPTELNQLLTLLKDNYNVSDAVIVSQQLQEVNQSVEKMEHIEDINVLVTSIISGMQFEHLSSDHMIEIYNNL